MLWTIGHVCLALENEVGALADFVLFLFVVIGMSPNIPKHLHFPKDNYKQKQCDTLPVRMITGIMNFNRL